MNLAKTKTLRGRLLQIASGRTTLPEERVRKYREKWAAEGFELPPLSAPPRTSRAMGDRRFRDSLTLLCEHLGPVKYQQGCSCGSNVKIDVHTCKLLKGVHDQPKLCVPGSWSQIKDEEARRAIVNCETCPHRKITFPNWPGYAGLPTIAPVQLDAPRRHLICHIWPVAGYGAWEWHCDQLLRRAELFNGRRIVAVVTSPDADPPQRVRNYLRDFTDEFIVLPNHARLREVATWLPLLERLESQRTEQDVTFTCHAKGVRHKVNVNSPGSTLFRWSAAMYDTCLYWPDAGRLLERHGAAGSFRRFPPRRWGGGWGPWHYTGTFYWFRNRDVFQRNWRHVLQKFFGTEAWPGYMFRPEEAGVIFCDEAQDLYKRDYFDGVIQPALEQWKLERNL